MIFELSNPLVKTLVTQLRDISCDAVRFRLGIGELSKHLVYEAAKEFPLITKTINTWNGKSTFESIDESNIVVVTVLRAGMPMLDSIINLLPDASAGFLAIKRDEISHESVLYYERLPSCKGKTILLVDPMVATGGSMIDALKILSDKSPSKIIALNIIASPQGLDRVHKGYPDVNIFIAQIDEDLDKNKYIIPGLGDAGDRAYNTPE